MAKPGPKPKPEPLRRTVTIATKLTPCEKTYIRRAAAARGQLVSHLIYDAVMDAADAVLLQALPRERDKT